MRIAMFTDTYEPQVNGVVTSIKRFTSELRKMGHEVYIFSPASPELKKSNLTHSFRSISFRNYPEYRIALPLIKGCQKKFDVIHVHSPLSVGLAGVALAKYYKLPLIGTFHTQLPEYTHYLIKRDRIRKIKPVEKITKRFAWKYCSWFYNHCDCVIAPTEDMKEILSKHKFRKRIIVLPTGTDIKKNKNSRSFLRKKYSFSPSDKIILHVGRITKEKNIEIILDAMKTVIKKNDAKLIITSDGPMRSELEKYAEALGISDNVIFTGYISDHALNDYYQLSDVFVMASKTETQGIVLIEAAANSLPSVVLDADVTAAFVRQNKTGLVANKKDFAKKLQYMLNNNKIKNNLKKNCLSAAKKYDIKKCTDDLVQAYSELIRMS